MSSLWTYGNRQLVKREKERRKEVKISFTKCIRPHTPSVKTLKMLSLCKALGLD